MIDSSFEDKTHWSEEKEAIKTNKPLKLVLFLLKVLPSAAVHVVCYPVAFFYFLFSAYGRKFATGYQKQLRRNKLQDAIWTISQEDKERNFREICGSLIGILNDIGFDVMEHRIEKAQLVIEQTTITIAENGGKVKVTRVAKTQAEEEA